MSKYNSPSFILHLGYITVIVLCLAPLAPGFIGVLSAAFGFIPAIGMDQISTDAFWKITQWPGVTQSLLLTIISSIVSTYGALLLCFAILQSLWLSRYWPNIEKLLAPLLALPHVAFAIGFAFLFAPTGFIARFIYALFEYTPNASEATSFIQDPNALGLTIALMFKEVPFLLFMSIPILQQLNVPKLFQSCRSMGYTPVQFWWKAVLPQWLPRIRFSLFAVAAYGVSVVDLGLILGPVASPTFAVVVWQWFNDPDLNYLPQAAAGAVVLFVLLCAVMVGMVTVEKLITLVWRRWQYSGRFGFALPGKLLMALCASLSIAIIPLLSVWSVAQRWSFPDLIPSQFTNRFWINEWFGVYPTLFTSLSIATISATLALILAMVAQQYRLRSRWRLPSYLFLIPMLLPQLSLLLGMQVTTLWLGAQHYYLWVIWSHLFFAFPFVYLALDGPWRSYNENFSNMALSLGKSRFYTFLFIKMPLLKAAILYAWALGASVSLAQYLPTLILGAGRITTITTEAVALSSGFDRRVTAIYALWQGLLPLVFFALSLLLSHRGHGVASSQTPTAHKDACSL